MLNVTDILESVVNGFHKRPFPEQYPVVPVHKRVLNVLFYFCGKVYVVNKKGLKKFLAYVSPFFVCHDTRGVELMIDIPVHLLNTHV